VENPLASTLHIHSFLAIIDRELHEKYSTTNPAITENTERLIVKALASLLI